MKITIIGTGYVGLATATCFAELGIVVTCVDADSRRINTLKYGGLPIYEQGLSDVVKANASTGRLHFTTDFGQALKDVDIVICAIDPPLGEDGASDVRPVLEAAAKYAQVASRNGIYVIKSTVPVGTAIKVMDIINDELAKRKDSGITLDVASNPDFLTEGNAVHDFMSPDRIVVGVETERARKAMAALYRPVTMRGNNIMFTDTRTAEMIKYAATSMLASRVSFMNEIANLCEKVGADINTVRRGVGSDSRIGNKYINPGCGYGGTCFPKDIKDLLKIADNNGVDMKVLKAIDSVNTSQKHIMFDKLAAYYNGDLKGKTVALWGLSFKPETADMHAAPSLVTLDLLQQAGCDIRVYDPIAMNTCKSKYPSVYCALDKYDAVKGADALLLLTDWRQFFLPEWNKVKELMRTPLVIDGRNIYDGKELESLGFAYHCIGK